VTGADDQGDGDTVERPRWPRRVYGDGSDPDYRFSFANERTFLAWIRTGLAMLAAGLALDVVNLSVPDVLQTVGASALLGLGLLCAVTAWLRWVASESAMRRSRPLPGFGSSMVVCAVLVALALTMAVAVWLG
jgi:putative membrane protein